MNSFVQISDLHIDDNNIAMGVDTHQNLDKILSKLKTIEFDHMLISGDLSHNGSIKSYKILKTKISKIFPNPVVISGNHDDKDNLKQAFKLVDKNTTINNWEIITTDSTQTGKTSGFLSTDNINKLDNDLANSNAKFIIVMLHHPFVDMNSSWDDSLSLKNPKDLIKILSKYKNIKAVLFGHAHEAKEFNEFDFKVISCPSTACQFTDEKRIGFNHYQLSDNGDVNYYTQWI